MINTTVRTPRRHVLAATVLATAALGGLAAGALGAATTATGATYKYVAVAYSPVNKHYMYGYGATQDVAVTASLYNCGVIAGHCALAALSPKDGCVVLSTRGVGEEYVGGSAKTLPLAMKDAQKKLYGSQVKVSYCVQR